MIAALAIGLALALALAACTALGRGRGSGDRPSPEAAGPARISGRVTASDTGEPVPYVQVVFFDLSGNQAGPPGNTDLAGAYELQLPPGGYYGVANLINPARPLGWNGFSPAWVDGLPVNTLVHTTEVTGGEHRVIDFKLARVRPCKGRVTAGGTANVPPTSVVSILHAASGQQLAEVSIDQSGEYQVSLPDGEWLLRFSVPGFVQRVALKVSVSGAPVEFPTQNLDPQS